MSELYRQCSQLLPIPTMILMMMVDWKHNLLLSSFSRRRLNATLTAYLYSNNT